MIRGAESQQVWKLKDKKTGQGASAGHRLRSQDFLEVQFARAITVNLLALVAGPKAVSD